MPEIAEVETVRKTLKEKILRKKIKNVNVLYERMIESDIDEFKKKINDYARKTMTGDGTEVCFEIDTEVKTEEVTLKLAEELSYMEPFGVGNPQPVLMLRDASVQTADSIGDVKHSKFTLNGKTALLFGVGLDQSDIFKGDTVDALFKLEHKYFIFIYSNHINNRIP